MTDIADRQEAEGDRRENIRDTEDRPATNPRYGGAIPGEVARALLRPKNPKIARTLDRLRKCG